MYDFEKETRRYNELLKRILPAYKEAKKELQKVRDYAPTNGKIVNAIKLYNRMEADMAYLQDGVRVEDWRKGYIPMALPSTLTHLQNIILAKYDVDEYPALKRANDEFKKRANEAFRLGKEIYNTVMRTGVSFGRNTMRRYGYRGVRFDIPQMYVKNAIYQSNECTVAILDAIKAARAAWDALNKIDTPTAKKARDMYTDLRNKLRDAYPIAAKAHDLVDDIDYYSTLKRQ